MNQQMMIDIETLGSRPGSAIIAIGIAVFDLDGDTLVHGRELLIDPEFTPGFRDPDTLDWWEEQDNGVFERMMSGTMKPWEACGAVAGFCAAFSNKIPVWANPPSFDIAMLRWLFEQYEIPFPIHYKRERDFRTIRKLADEFGINYNAAYEDRVRHDALEDAYAQAAALKIILHDLALIPPGNISKAAQAMGIEKIRNVQ